MKILLVEDDEQRYNNFKSALTSMPEDSCFANSEVYGEALLEKIKTQPDPTELYFELFKTIEEKEIELIFIDFFLLNVDDKGNAPTGVILANKLRNNVLHKEIPMVLHSRQYNNIDDFREYANLMVGSVHYMPTENVTNRVKSLTNRIKETFNNMCTQIVDEIKNYKSREFTYNLAIVTALEKEMEPVKEFISDSKRIKSSDDKSFKKGFIENKDTKTILKVVFKTPDEAGDLTAQNISQTMIRDFKPKYIAMTGIAGGFKDNVKLGDIVIVRHSFNWQQGKYEGDNFLQRTEPFIIDKCLKRIIKEDFLEDFNDNKFSIEDFLNKFDNREKITTLKKAEEIKTFKFQFGPFATGSAVIASKKKGESILNLHDKSGGLDMEIYAIYKAAYESNIGVKAIAIKGIVDYIDESKGDDWHVFASYASAQTLYKLFTEYIDMESNS